MAESDWLLGNIPQLKGVRHTVLVTSDGLVRAHCASTDRDDAERAAAAISGAQSLARALAGQFPPEVDHGGPEDPCLGQMVITIPGGHVFMRPAGTGSVLAVVTDMQANPGMIAQFMQERVQQLGRGLETPARTPGPEHG
ncbi:roadblock/LC7 domain-containing protein [Streptomyces sp. NPDC093149]|uniref:roadblock/LC7 domain-containing protein n=1 Tax=Streptomyces sp. NPDC093149 TaxID=3366031 RepID=UPI0037FC6E81